ncbi:MAG: hypothetical protein GY829_05160, partial [Gammaproteobacteria bacterium]|nr:hypothetical protein [Gammaproteobacteria bacterium]
SDGRVIQHNNSNGNLRITGIAGDNLQVGSILLVSNCERGAIFQVSTSLAGSTYYLVKNLVNGTGTSMTPGNSTRDLGSRYLDASVARLGTRTYFIANSGFDDNVSALWRIDNAADPVELLQGVENLQISYGVDTNGDRVVDNYVAANAVGSWANVSSVRLNILISSLSDNVVNLGGNKQTYIFNGEDVTATDYRLRKEFTTTVAIRNLLQ